MLISILYLINCQIPVQGAKQGGIFGEKEYLKKSENKYKKQLSKQAKKDKEINKSNVSSFHWEDEI